VLPFPILLASAVLAGPAQQPSQGPPVARFNGLVVNSQTHQPLRRAAIMIDESGKQWTTYSDRDGRFTFLNLEPGDGTLTVHRDGYTDRTYKIASSDFNKQTGFSAELDPQGLITGRVVDGTGQPLQGTVIEALRPSAQGSNLEAAASTETNDVGEFRLASLDPGTFRVRATYREGRTSEFDPTPLTVGTAWLGGPDTPTSVEVKSGSAIGEIDFVLNPVRPVTIRGTLHTDRGMLRERATLWIQGQAGEGGHNDSAEKGNFEVSDVFPGTWTVSAQTLSETSPLFGVTTVSVRNFDVDGVDILLRPVPILEGELAIEGAVPAGLALGPVYFNASNRVNSISFHMARPDRDRKFSTPLVSGEYTLAFDASITGLGIKEVTLDGKPVTDWTLRISDAPETKKLLIVLKGAQEKGGQQR